MCIKDALDKLLICHNVLGVVTQISYFTDVVIYVFSPNLKDGFAISAIEPLVKTFEGAMANVK